MADGSWTWTWSWTHANRTVLRAIASDPRVHHKHTRLIAGPFPRSSTESPTWSLSRPHQSGRRTARRTSYGLMAAAGRIMCLSQQSAHTHTRTHAQSGCKMQGKGDTGRGRQREISSFISPRLLSFLRPPSALKCDRQTRLLGTMNSPRCLLRSDDGTVPRCCPCRVRGRAIADYVRISHCDITRLATEHGELVSGLAPTGMEKGKLSGRPFSRSPAKDLGNW